MTGNSVARTFRWNPACTRTFSAPSASGSVSASRPTSASPSQLPSVAGLCASITQDDDSATAALDQERRREDEHRIDRLREAHARVALETEPRHHRGHGVRVRIGVSCARREHVRGRPVGLQGTCKVCGGERLRELWVHGERLGAGPAKDCLKDHQLSIPRCRVRLGAPFYLRPPAVIDTPTPFLHNYRAQLLIPADAVFPQPAGSSHSEFLPSK